MQYEIPATEMSSPPRLLAPTTPQELPMTKSFSPMMRSKKSLPDLRTVKQNQYPGALELSKVQTSLLTSNNSRSEVVSPYLSLHRAATSTSPNVIHQEGVRNTERNAYFKRFSTQMKPSISKPISQVLLSVIDSVRGIYFAIHQIYEQVDSYTSWTLDERISVILRKILEPAQFQISQIPLALDRFDLLVAHHSQPPVAICRRVLETCRDNIAVCGKVVAALQLHLKVLAGADDIRFTRSLVLMLYGSMAEIAHAWQNILINKEEVQPYLADTRPANIAKPSTHGTERRTNAKRSRNTRRHAGSFSLRDVEIGRSMSSPPPELMPDKGHGLPGGHSQHAHDAHMESNISKARSPTPSQPQHRTPAPQHLDLPDNSSQTIDRELVETISLTVTSAQHLWELLADPNDPVLGSRPLSSKMLNSATVTTNQLASVIRAIQGVPGDLGGRQLFEETLSFIKVLLLFC
jgi:hypothetical protein